MQKHLLAAYFLSEIALDLPQASRHYLIMWRLMEFNCDRKNPDRRKLFFSKLDKLLVTVDVIRVGF